MARFWLPLGAENVAKTIIKRNVLSNFCFSIWRCFFQHFWATARSSLDDIGSLVGGVRIPSGRSKGGVRKLIRAPPPRMRGKQRVTRANLCGWEGACEEVRALQERIWVAGRAHATNSEPCKSESGLLGGRMRGTQSPVRANLGGWEGAREELRAL